MPKFSVIVPVYNVEEYLDECVQSVINQTFTDWELILVDDGATDNCPKMCDDYAKTDDRIKVIHKKNGGLSDARNTGIDNAIGEYGIFLDSDDYWNQINALELLNKKIENYHSDIIMFGCTDFNMLTGESYVSRSDYDYSIIQKNNKDEILHYLLRSKKLPGAAWLISFKKDLFNELKFRFKVGIQDEDYDFILTMFVYCNSISSINDTFYTYRKGRSGSITSSSNIKMIYGIEYTINKWLPICEVIENEVIKKDVLNYLAFIYSTGFVVCGRMDKSMRKEALSIMKKHFGVLDYAYWKKPIITKYAVKLVGMDIFSKMAVRYFDKTHIF